MAGIRNAAVVVTALLICISDRGPKTILVARTTKPCLAAAGYYIAVRARLQSEALVYVQGASNLPPGSILTLEVYDFAGLGGKTYSREAMVAVGKDGLFEAGLQPVEGLSFRDNLLCSVVFGPSYPRQSKEVLTVVGRHGENLGSTATNPQVETASGGQLLDTTTVVHD